MSREIERKFLVKRERWRADAAGGIVLRQGYLSDDPVRVVRVRVAGDKAFLTIKGLTVGVERAEFEYEIPVDDANALLETMCARPLIEKTRHRVDHDGHAWYVDVFAGENAGLMIAEIELPRPDTTFSLPDWADTEVSDDPRYFNSNLARHPYCAWGGDPGRA